MEHDFIPCRINTVLSNSIIYVTDVIVILFLII
jgi:hypothetical protein